MFVLESWKVVEQGHQKFHIILVFELLACRVSISIRGRPKSLECIAESPVEAQTLIGWFTALEIAAAQQSQ